MKIAAGCACRACGAPQAQTRNHGTGNAGSMKSSEDIESKIVRSEKVSIENTVAGMVLADDVKNEAGGVVLAADSILTKTHLARLRKQGVMTLYIQRWSPPKEFNALRGKTAIVIDDSLFFRHMFGKLMYRMGMFVCEEAETGEQGLVFAKRYKPDLVVVDIHLPGMSGIRAIRKLRKAVPHARVLAVSVDKNRQTVVDALRAGAHHFLGKPINWDSLKPQILNLFGVDENGEQRSMN